MTTTDAPDLDAILNRIRQCGNAVPKVAAAVSLFAAEYLELLIADLDRQINDASSGNLDAMTERCPGST
ncbi:hypothetical protein [Mycobacterium antarcticum]|uniref:hypothetical protein n=1 Tax=Mycolicibacterium sp. TUM20984 TaxID=3023368 RepID=UPI0023908A77|nr:hypothetical protein [Mycolicibacterium sp. TUM20984]GLP83577.1 hypothetical protein TUM20984_49970 [Mycolicibacterium sp. TUM20984]